MRSERHRKGMSRSRRHPLANAYGPNLERLVEIERRYDLASLFRLDHNIHLTG
jgi:Berberine and berberine like